MCPHRDPLDGMNRGDHEIGPFKILGPALASGIAFGGCAQIAVVPQTIAEVDRILLNFNARFWYVQSSID